MGRILLRKKASGFAGRAGPYPPALRVVLDLFAGTNISASKRLFGVGTEQANISRRRKRCDFYPGRPLVASAVRPTASRSSAVDSAVYPRMRCRAL